MNETRRVGSPIYAFLPTEVGGFDSLAELAPDMQVFVVGTAIVQTVNQEPWYAKMMGLSVENSVWRSG